MHQLSTALTALNSNLNISNFLSLLNNTRITPFNKISLNTKENVFNEVSTIKPTYLFISSSLSGVITTEEAIGKVKQISPKTKVVLLIDENDSLRVTNYLVTNVDAIIFSENISETFEFAIKQISRGETFICSRTTFELKVELLQKNLENKIETGLLELLTERELEVLHSLTQGINYKQTSKLLFISESTVKTHINNIFTKLNVNDRTQAVLYALKHGIEDIIKKPETLNNILGETANK